MLDIMSRMIDLANDTFGKTDCVYSFTENYMTLIKSDFEQGQWMGYDRNLTVCDGESIEIKAGMKGVSR